MAARWSEADLDGVETSLKNLCSEAGLVNWVALRALLSEQAHVGHKDWHNTKDAAHQLAAVLGGPHQAEFRNIFRRVLTDGHWDRAAEAAASREESDKPWVVLVTGLNGIRKTTSAYQPWFNQALQAAVRQSVAGENADSPKRRKLDSRRMPDGHSSFFRQLDYMIASLANEEFRALYTADHDVSAYSKQKAAIFSKYRMLAEMLGVLLMEAAQSKGMDVMLETSGRDIAMFQYVDAVFDEEKYRKLVVHFRINDIKHAAQSVDLRMAAEMSQGKKAVSSDDVRAIVDANAGGPYGSEVLAGVQKDSDRVWQQVVADGSDMASWDKATLDVHGSDDGDWTVAVDGTDLSFQFVPIE